MPDHAEKKGLLAQDSVIIDPAGGNTGIGLAAAAAAGGYKVILTMPETMSTGRRNLLRACGTELVLTDGAEGMKGAIRKAGELTKAMPGSYMPSQFTNAADPKVHYRTAGPETVRDTAGNAGIGTGVTLSGGLL